jgi:two-component system, OmpR family, sensor kinase
VTFRGRLLATAVGVTCLAMGGAFAGVWFAFNASQEGQLDRSLSTRARLEASHLQKEGKFTGRPGPAANDVGPLPTFGVLYDEHGEVIITTNSLLGKPAPMMVEHDNATCFNAWYGELHLRATMLQLKGPVPRTLWYAVPRSDIDGDDQTLARAMALALLVAVAWAAAVTWWVLRRLTRAHDSIAHVARRVAAGDLAARVSQPPFADEEVLQLSRDVDDMIGRLQGLVASQRQFIAHAAHELRSPLTTLYGELQHALARPRGEEAYRESIGEALQSTRRLRDLAEDLLAFARLGTTRERGDARVDLELLATELCARLKGQADALSVTLTLTTSRVYVLGTVSDLERALRNLVENAMRYGGEGGSVRIDVRKAGARARIVVEDDGPGVDPADVPRIFDPFYRSPRERGKPGPGAGLGLAIVREIVHGHGGDVQLANEEGTARRGARFVVDLPLAPS